MQVNFNPQQNNQQFGMAIHSNEVVNKIIKNRIKTPEQLERLSSIIDKAAENTTLDIHLYVNPDEKTIGANISSASDLVLDSIDASVKTGFPEHLEVE